MLRYLFVFLFLVSSLPVFSANLEEWADKIKPDSMSRNSAQPNLSSGGQKKMQELDFVNSIYSALPPGSNCPVRFIVGPASSTQPVSSDMNHVVAVIQGYCKTPNNMHLYMGSKCIILGSSTANAALSRIYVSIYLVSCVRDDGTTWQFPSKVQKGHTIGYLAGVHSLDGQADNYVGIEAKRFSDKSKYVWIKSMLDLLSVYAIARADAETSEEVVSSSSGQTLTLNNVDGDKDVYAAGKALGEGVLPGFNELVLELYNEARGYLIIESNVRANVFYLEPIDVSGLTEKIKLSRIKFEHFAL